MRSAVMKFSALLVAVVAAHAVTAQEIGDVQRSALDLVKERGLVYVAHRSASSPFGQAFESTTPDGYVVKGYSWEVCAEVVKGLEQSLGKSLSIVPVSSTANNRFLLVKSGIAQMECGATTNLLSRQKLVSFSNTFYVAEGRILVKKDSGIASLSDLNNKKLVVLSGSSADRLVRQAAASRGVRLETVVARNAADAIRMLQNGLASGFVGDDVALSSAVALAGLQDSYAFTREVLSVEPYAITLPKDDVAFKAAVNASLNQLMASGALEQIYNKWFMSPIPPNDINLNLPMSNMLKNVIQNPNDKPAM